jgi:uncharacterized protein
MKADAQIFTGHVVHKRLRPKPHALKYGVYSLLLDVDRISAVASTSRLFSRNRFNVLSFHDADHGPGDGTPVEVHARELLRNAGFDAAGGRVFILGYPRVLGYVFNPLSVYYAFDANERLIALIYEVNNTWGERRSYVVPAGERHGRVFAQSAIKALHVSPFAPPNGRYGFRVSEPDQDLTVGVSLSDQDGALLKTHFHGVAESWSDRRLLGLLFRFPLLTTKVIGAIHFEALKLWLKGVPLTRGASTPGYAVSYAPPSDATPSPILKQ